MPERQAEHVEMAKLFATIFPATLLNLHFDYL